MEAIHSDGSMTVAKDGFFMAEGEMAIARYGLISLLSALDLYEKTGMEVRRNYLKSGAYWLEQVTGEKVLTPSNRLTSAGRRRMREMCEQLRAHIEQNSVVVEESS